MVTALRRVARAWFAALGLLLCVAWPCAARAVHVRTIEGPVLHAEEGLLIGNGDLSCSLYQNADALVFRLGKGDVWDRRVITNGCVRPAHIREYREGVLREGWRCNPFDDRGTVAEKGAKDPQRMRELCNGGRYPISDDSPCPCPKPTGEFWLRLPVDLPGPMRVSQRLTVEEGRLDVTCRWPGGAVLRAEAVVDPVANVLSVAWRLTGWSDATYYGKRRERGVTYVLMRTRDRTLREWAAEGAARYGGLFEHYCAMAKRLDVPALPAPVAARRGAAGCVEQAFYPDPLFPEGFRCRLTLRARDCEIYPAADAGVPGAAAVRGRPTAAALVGDTLAGEASVAVTTSSDRSLEPPPPKSHAEYAAAAKTAAAAATARAALALPQDRALEDLWYLTCHARRCVMRADTVPPGLFFPSTIGDCSFWHGDWHANYNLVSAFWGDIVANRLDEAAAYFTACDFFADIGRKIARDYYGARGVFIPLEGFPVRADDDYGGRLPLGRMVYMTGWMADRYWEYYDYLRDKAWLARRGYPFIRDCALFYLDFLIKAPHRDLPPQLADGKYHAFPSVCGESAIADPMKLCDGPQVMMHVRHTLWYAIRAAETLGVDDDLRRAWRVRLENLPAPWAPTGDAERDFLNGIADPEHTPHGVAPYRAVADAGDGAPAPDMVKGEETWYFGHTIRHKIGLARNPVAADKLYANLRAGVMRWQHANGLVWAMAQGVYGRSGAWTETLSCMAPFQEMLLQSWDGAINVFPRWPQGCDAAFENWRARGAFRVSASWANGCVTRFEVVSERGESCVVQGDWRVTDERGEAVALRRDRFGRMAFDTVPGARYRLAARPGGTCAR